VNAVSAKPRNIGPLGGAFFVVHNPSISQETRVLTQVVVDSDSVRTPENRN
jgi:hypothetical protein